MYIHTATQITTLPYNDVHFMAFVDGKLLHAGEDDYGASVTYDDEQGPRLDGFAPTIMGLHVDVVAGKPLYVGVRQGKELVMHGRKEGRYCDRVCGLFGSPQGSVGYGVTEGEESFVIVDGVEGKRYPSIWPHAFADGKMLYAADLQKLDRSLLGKGKRAWDEAFERKFTCLVFGSEEGKPYRSILKDGCRPLIVGGRQVYGVLHPDGTCSIVDGSREGERYQGVSDLCCDSTGIPLYHAIERNAGRPGKHVLVRGTEEVVRHDHIEYASWVNGRPLYVAWQIKGEEKESFLMYGSDRFDYDCHIGFPDIVDGQPFFVGQTGGFVGDDRPLGRFIVHGGTRGRAYDNISELEVVDGKPLYVASLPEERYDEEWYPIPPHQRVVYGAQEGVIYARVTDLTHAGSIPIYCAWTDDSQACVIIGEDEGYFFDAVFSLQFDPKRREVARTPFFRQPVEEYLMSEIEASRPLF